jgi:peptide/nickel transport system substrate-binding protein
VGLDIHVAYGQDVVDVLEKLGYHASLHGPEGYFAKAYPPVPGVQIAIDGWVQDYPSPDNFLSLLACNKPWNLTRLCDLWIEAAIARARAGQISRPELAAPLWAEVDHLGVDLGVQIDLLNPAGMDFLSSRVGNAQHNPQWGLLLDQAWVR